MATINEALEHIEDSSIRHIVKAIEEAGFQASVASMIDEVSGPVVRTAPPVLGPKSARYGLRG